MSDAMQETCTNHGTCLARLFEHPTCPCALPGAGSGCPESHGGGTCHQSIRQSLHSHALASPVPSVLCDPVGLDGHGIQESLELHGRVVWHRDVGTHARRPWHSCSQSVKSCMQALAGCIAEAKAAIEEVLRLPCLCQLGPLGLRFRPWRVHHERNLGCRGSISGNQTALHELRH